MSCAGGAGSRYLQLIEEIKSSRRAMPGGAVSYAFSTPAIHCGQCISAIERPLSRADGVVSVRANLSLRCVSVIMANETWPLLPVVEALEGLGYAPQSVIGLEGGSNDNEVKHLVRALAVAGFAAANIMLLSVSVWTGAEGATRDLFHFVSALIAIPAVAYAGMPFFRSAVAGLRHRRMNMDVPISLGVILATAMSLYESFLGGGHAYFDAATSLLFFLLIGRTLDRVMRAKARRVAGSLARLSAKGAVIVDGKGELNYVPIGGVQAGMIMRVAAGERFPADGDVISGASDIDRSLVTGESAPVAVRAGSPADAGTLNLTGPLDVRVTRPAGQSFLADVMQMMAAAEQGRGRHVQIADRMAQIYSPAVHILAFASFLGWLLYTNGDWHQSLTAAVSVLIITCPCALGLAVPVAHVMGASRLFEAGILMKDGSALERLAAIDHAVFDKTGTLTTGEPVVSSSVIPNGEPAAIAKALALASIHPAARALARFIPESPSSLTELREVPGHGVEGRFGKKIVRLGRGSWVSEIAIGKSIEEGLAFAIEGGAPSGVSLREELRPGVVKTLAALGERGIASELLSGDAAPEVYRMAARLNFAHVQAGLKPGGKLARIQELAGERRKVLMIGDGLNDAPALAAAHVSMAPASASDIGRMAADFVFTRAPLTAVSFAHRVALRNQRIVRENFGLAVLYNIFAVPLAMAGQLNPLIAAVAMSTSSIIVVGNSLRLYRVREAKERAPIAQAVMVPA
ncbi:MAG: heavy metal translocating P-type ATPase [Rhodospirillales bacterium]|nr:heavy metal translocating P-type ATPase [Rhodospirillales bacterium]